jgi:hypothetical protein
MQGLPDMNGWIVAAIVAAIALYVIFVFNRLIRLRNLAREGWSGIDVQLKRSDLVPNLVATVRAATSLVGRAPARAPGGCQATHSRLHTLTCCCH